MADSLILISACLLGIRTRYDGGEKRLRNDDLHELLSQGKLLPVCPEVAGGLPTPRPPSEIIGGDGSCVLSGKCPVKNLERKDVTAHFLSGAEIILQKANQFSVRFAIFKDGSPSCGTSYIYDGSFSGGKIKGCGVTTSLLKANGISVYNERNFEQLFSLLKNQKDVS